MATRSSSRRSRRTERKIASSNDWDRRHLPGVQLHESEKLLVGVLTVLLVLLPWMLGSTHVPAQAVAALLAAASLGAALLPRHGDTHSVTSMGQLKRLFAFPVFWLGGLLLIYLLVQGFNTARIVEGTEGFRYLTETAAIGWLPAGVSAPFTESNPFRWVLILVTPFLAVCAATIGITRRKSIQILLAALSVNALCIAAVAFFQIAKNKPKILGFFEPPTRSFLGTFPHHWQGAAFLVIAMAAAAGLAAHHYARARKTFTRSNPSGLYLFVALALMMIAIFSLSRATAASAGAIMGIFLVHIAYRELAQDAALSRKVFLNSVGVIAVALCAWLAGNVGGNYLEQKQAKSSAPLPIAETGNWSATTGAGLALLREKPLYGWGAGSFRHLYKDASERAEIEEAPITLAKEYAASDWIRFAAELGAAGLLLLLLILGFLLKQFFHVRTLQNPLVAFLLVGVLLGLALSFGSLLFENVTVLTTWSLLLAFGGILIRVEAAARSRTETGLD